MIHSPLDVMTAFYDVRVEFYGKRKSHLLDTLTDSWEKLDNKVSPRLLIAYLLRYFKFRHYYGNLLIFALK